MPSLSEGVSQRGAVADAATLLADRFHLQLHREAEEGPVYVPAAGSKELKLKPAKNADDYPWVGRPGGGAISGTGIAGTNITMSLLAARLTG